MNQTPSAFHQLMQTEERLEEAPELSLSGDLRRGGAGVVRSQAWFDRHGDERPRLVNMYGITETTVHVTYRPLGREDLQKGNVIGGRFPTANLYPGRYRQPVPIGVPGEL